MPLEEHLWGGEHALQQRHAQVANVQGLRSVEGAQWLRRQGQLGGRGLEGEQGAHGQRGPGRRQQPLVGEKAPVELDKDSKLFASKMPRQKGSLNE